SDTWKIWIGRFRRGDWPGYWVHNTMPIYAKDDVHELTEFGFPKPNTQTTTIVFGELYVHAFSCPFPDIVERLGLGERGASLVAQIWPIGESFIGWPLSVHPGTP